MHDIAAAGIRTLITPPSAFTGGMYDVQHWRTFNAPTGAVEIYSSLDQVAPWPESEYPLTPGSAADHDRWRHFLVRHAVRCWHRRRQLYRNVGLHEAFAVALNLRVLAREPGVAFQGTLGDYGVRDLAKTIDEADFLHTHQRLRPIGLKLLLTQLGEFGGDRPVSVRQAVTR
jgi:hypothetical protein